MYACVYEEYIYICVYAFIYIYIYIYICRYMGVNNRNESDNTEKSWKSIGNLMSLDIIFPSPDEGSLKPKRYDIDFLLH